MDILLRLISSYMNNISTNIPLCCIVNKDLSCELCGIQWCSDCHDNLYNDGGTGDNHQVDLKNGHRIVKCLATGEWACDPAASIGAIHVKKCTHLDVLPQERT